MNHILPGPTAAKLAKVAELLASPQPGEVLAAAAAGTRLLRAAGLTWRDAIAGTCCASQPGTAAHDATPTHATVAREALRHAHLLTAWETTFLDSIAMQLRPLSFKQKATLADIVKKLHRAAAP